MEGNRDWWAETRDKPLLSSRRNQRATLQRCLPAPLRSMAGQMCRKEKLQLPARFPGVPSRSARTPRRLKPPDDGEWEGSVLGLYHNSSGGQLVKTQDLNLLVVLFRPDPGPLTSGGAVSRLPELVLTPTAIRGLSVHVLVHRHVLLFCIAALHAAASAATRCHHLL